MDAEKVNLFIVEQGSPEGYEIDRLLSKAAGRISFSVSRACSLAGAVRLLSRKEADIILLDLNLPDSSGLETFAELSDLAPETPVIVLSDSLDESEAVGAVQMGAQDYLVKRDIAGDHLVKSILYAIERQRMNVQLRNLSTTDDLTGLSNRRGFIQKVGRELKMAEKIGRSCMLSFLDIDGLKEINDTYGHGEGDRALKVFSGKLKKIFGEGTIIARIGGDEFTVFAPGSPEARFKAELERLKKKLDVYNLSKRNPYTLSVSAGVASFDPSVPCSIDALLSKADLSMYRDKESRRTGAPFWTMRHHYSPGPVNL
ncbi:MAG TPA: GGDEF domain-containing response regulator [Thermodesulfobacteriota bacterium]|nr:GGDEF domain-containing response regulator [Thermodesulfobacteriota bacterium]